MEAEFHWKHQEIVGVVCQGRLGLGHYSEKRWSRADARARRGLVVQRVREAAEEERQVKAIGLASQGQWTQWDQAQERPLSWKELWQIDQGRHADTPNPRTQHQSNTLMYQGDVLVSSQLINQPHLGWREALCLSRWLTVKTGLQNEEKKGPFDGQKL
ncbi:hypothetical protein G5714_019829 [Onychostoma macrolepis]|uniref:Uncharacterized protein n=1 Tax=Onychostoma macrolepis TaxID=369639 RepID=A0A7J6BYX2_9TELE|nr:hypothetical protein G5714_019829 [Onychostoma macrolepis]